MRCGALLFEITCLNTPKLFCRVDDAPRVALRTLSVACAHGNAAAVATSCANACLAACVQNDRGAAIALAQLAEGALQLMAASGDALCVAQASAALAEYHMARLRPNGVLVLCGARS